MDNKEGLKLILKEALDYEVKAEDNCDKILHVAKINGFHKAVEHILNDEKRHQEMVKKLIGYLE
jgi:rubrerythrin